ARGCIRKTNFAPSATESGCFHHQTASWTLRAQGFLRPCLEPGCGLLNDNFMKRIPFAVAAVAVLFLAQPGTAVSGPGGGKGGSGFKCGGHGHHAMIKGHWCKNNNNNAWWYATNNGQIWWQNNK